MSGLTVTGALLDGERVGLRCSDGVDRGARARGGARGGRRDDRRRRRAADPGARQRPHPRRDDPLPRLRRRPAADALAAGEGLAGRGEARRGGRLLGLPPRLPGDDPDRDRALLGHVLAAGGDRPRRHRQRPAGDDRRAPVRRRRRDRADAEHGAGRARGAGGVRAARSAAPSPRTRSTPSARGCCAGPRRSPPRRGCRSRSTSPRPSRRSRTASQPTANARPPTSTGSACSASGRCSPTASGSIATSSS